METTTQTPTGTQSSDPGATTAPDLQRMASDLAAKHGQNGKQRTGRRTAAEEAAEYLRRNRMQAVPVGDPDQAPVDSGPGYVVDPDFVRRMADMALKGIEAYQQRATYLKALAIGADKDLAKELATGNGAPPGAIDVMSHSMAEITQKYGLLNQWTPEIALIVAAGTWMTSHVTTMRRLSAIAEECKAASKAKNPTP